VARPRSRVRPLEASGNRRPREMTVAPHGAQNPAYSPSLARFLTLPPFPRRLSEISRRRDRRTAYVPRRFEQLHDPPSTRGADVRVALRGRHRLVPQQIANECVLR
jgi:hypothetical protein